MNNKFSFVLASMLLATTNCQPMSTASTANAGELKKRTVVKAKMNNRLSATAQTVRAFQSGAAESYSPAQLVAAGVFESAPLVGGTYTRQEAIKHIVLHSTETESPADALQVVRSWNNRGKSHPGTQYLVERDGTIYQTVSPEVATMHVNAARTRFGVTNRNSIGIEIVRSGRQKYTARQLSSLTRLCVYLQKRFDVNDEKVVSHSHVQPHNRRDPVDFNWTAFAASKTMLNSLANRSPDRGDPTVALDYVADKTGSHHHGG